MTNTFDKAYEVAAKLTRVWIDERLKMGICVSEKEMAEKFAKFYENALLNTMIDVLNF
jgi:hypothetical protein